MRKLLPFAALLIALGWAQTAQAQYANKSITVSPSYLFTDKQLGFDGALPLYIGGTLYLEGGFELYSQFPIALVREQTRRGDQWVFGWGNHTGVRYLFMEGELFRPYVGLELAYLQILGVDQTRHFAGPGAVLGFDYFLSDSISLGLRGQADLFITLGANPLIAYGGGLTLGVWFN